MKKHLISFLVLLVITTSGYGANKYLQSKTSVNQLLQQIKPVSSWNIYPNYSDREGWNKIIGEYRSEFIENGNRYLDYIWQVVPASAYLEFERSGNRKVMENPLDANIIAISNLLFAELAEGKGRFIPQLINGVFSTCEMSSWALSAHLIVQPSRRALPSHKHQVIDLVSGDISALFSWIHYFFKEAFDKVDPEIASRLRYELQERILKPYMDGNRYWWMALGESFNGLVNNWNPWCNSNVLQTALLIEEDETKRAEIVFKTMQSVDAFLDFVKSDGACEEGPAYWGHAAGKLYDYLQILFDATDGEISLFHEPQVVAMGEYISKSYVGKGWVVNFADASARMNLDYHQIYRYGKAIESKEMMEFASYLKEKQPIEFKFNRDIYRMLSTLNSAKEIENSEPQHSQKSAMWYPETQFVYLPKGKAFFAAKGGHNNESHNHNDIGTFTLYLNEHPVIIDAGVGTYTRQTFSSERYQIWSMQSNFHNIPLINGFPQQFGRKFRSKEVSFDNRKSSFSLDIAGAYPKEANIEKWIRSYKVSNKELLITDEFKLSEATTPNQLHFMSWGAIDVSKPGLVTIRTGDEVATLQYEASVFTVELEPIELKDPRMSKVWGDTIYRLVFRAQSIETKGEYKFKIKY